MFNLGLVSEFGFESTFCHEFSVESTNQSIDRSINQSII